MNSIDKEQAKWAAESDARTLADTEIIKKLDKLIDSVEPPHGFYNPKTGEILYVKDIERLKKERANLSGVC